MFAVAVVGIFAGDAVGEFVEVSFSGEDGAGGVEGVDEVAVARRRRADLGKESGAGESGEAGNVEEIFEEIGDAGERRVGRRRGVCERGDEFVLRDEVSDDGALLSGRKRADAAVEFAGSVGGVERFPVAKSHGEVRRKVS